LADPELGPEDPELGLADPELVLPGLAALGLGLEDLIPVIDNYSCHKE
jgi:hypothetical protein